MSMTTMAAMVRRAVRRVRRTLWTSTSADWYCLRLAEHEGSDESALTDPPDVTVCFDEPATVAAWLAQLAGQFRWVFVPEELDAAARYRHPFGLLRLAGQPAGYIKVGIEQAFVTDLGRRLSLPPGVAFIYDTFVHPAYRGRRLAGVLVRRALAHLHARGIRGVWCHIPRWNEPSVRTYLRAGFRRVKRITQFRLAGLQFATSQPESMLWADSTQPSKDRAAGSFASAEQAPAAHPPAK